MSPVNPLSPRARSMFAGLAIAALVTVAACGSSGTGSTATARSSAPASAAASGPAASINLLAEVDATVAGIAEALAKYTAGDKQGALDAIAETYEDHFELIEGPLGDIDHDFMESIEELIAVKIRAAINEGKTATAVGALAAEATTALAKARDLLK